MPAVGKRLRNYAKLAGFLVICAFSSTQFAGGQEPPTKPYPPESAPSTLNGGAVKPDGFYLYDKDTGNKIMVPGLTFQELDRLRGLDSARRPKTDPFNIEQTRLDIVVPRSAKDEPEVRHAIIDLEMRVRVDASPDERVRVPLQLPGSYLVDPLQVEGIAGYHVELTDLPADQKSPNNYVGYTLSLQPLEPTVITVKGKFRTPIKSQTGFDTLELQLPDTTTKVRLNLPQTDLEVDVVGRGDAIINNVPAAEDSNIEIDSNGGAFTIRWQRTKERAGPTQVLDVEGNWLVTWPSQTDRVKVLLTLRVENLRGTVGSFEVVIPESAVLATETLLLNPKLQLSPPSGSSQTNWLVSPLEGDAPAPIELHLELEFPGANITAERPFQMPIVEVVGALRQRGKVQVNVQRPERLRWTPGPSVRPTIADTTSIPAESRRYAFDYRRLPIALSLWTDNPQEQLRLTPRMVINVSEHAAEMVFSVRGTTTAVAGQPIEIDLHDWKLLQVEGISGPLSGDAYRLAGQTLIVEPDAVLPSAFGNGAPTMQLLIHAGRAIDTRTVSCELPVLRVGKEGNSATLIEPLDIEIRPDSGWLFVPDLDASNALERITAATGEALLLRARPSNSPPSLKGYLLPHQRELKLDRNLKFTAKAESVDVEEHMHFQSNSALTSLELKLPLGDRLDAWRIMVDGVRVAIDQSTEVVRVIPLNPLPPGDHELVLLRTIPLKATNEGARATVPVVDFVRIEATPRDEVPCQVVSVDGVRLEVARSSEDFVSTSNLMVGIPPEGLSIRASIVSPAIVNHRIERLWLQTVSGGSQLRERAVLRLNRPPRKLRLPANMIPSQATIQAAVGTQMLPVFRTSDQQLELLLPPSEESISVTITIWTNIVPQNRILRNLRPLLERWGEGVEQVYWQIVVPPNEHAIQLPSGSATGMQWHWRDWRFVRIPTLNDDRLANWSGIPVEATPPMGNRYLVHSVGGLELKSLIIERSLLWSLVAGAVLGCATLWIYTRTARHPLSIILLSLCFGGAAIIWPDASLLCGQLAIVAGLFVVAMLALRSTMLRQPRRSALGPTPILRQDRSGRQAIVPLPGTREATSTRGKDFSFHPAGDSQR